MVDDVISIFSFQFVIGSGENMSDFTYVENVAHAHVCAEEALVSRMVSVAGKVLLHFKHSWEGTLAF